MCEAVDAFRRDPVGFMRANIVRPFLLDEVKFSASGKYWVTLTEFPTKPQARDLLGTPVRAFSLVHAEENAPSSFQVFWCSYAEDKAHSVVVDTTARFLFTATMSGCSLGVGSRTPEGARLVSHTNCATVGELVGGYAGPARGAIAQRLLQDALVRQTHGDDDGVEVISPGEYRRDHLKPGTNLDSTTFGVYDDETEDWAFYVQKRDGIYELVGVFFVAGVQPPVRTVQTGRRSGGGCILF